MFLHNDHNQSSTCGEGHLPFLRCIKAASAACWQADYSEQQVFRAGFPYKELDLLIKPLFPAQTLNTSAWCRALCQAVSGCFYVREAEVMGQGEQAKRLVALQLFGGPAAQAGKFIAKCGGFMLPQRELREENS